MACLYRCPVASGSHWSVCTDVLLRLDHTGVFVPMSCCIWITLECLYRCPVVSGSRWSVCTDVLLCPGHAAVRGDCQSSEQRTATQLLPSTRHSLPKESQHQPVLEYQGQVL